MKWKKSNQLTEYADQIFSILQENVIEAVDHFIDHKLPALKGGIMAWRPHIDLKETDTEYILHADIPGVSKNDLHVEIVDDVLVIRGQRISIDKKASQTHHWAERFHGEFSRSFKIPEDMIEHDQIEAEFENGVLTVVLKKKPGRQKKRGAVKKIDIK